MQAAYNLRRRLSVEDTDELFARDRTYPKHLVRRHRTVDDTGHVARSLSAVDGAAQLLTRGGSHEDLIGAVARLLAVLIGAGHGEGPEYRHHATQVVVVGNPKSGGITLATQHRRQLVRDGDDNREGTGPESVRQALGRLGPLHTRSEERRVGKEC